MTLRRQLLSALAIQGAGAVSLLLATLLLGARLGPAMQGSFSHTKAEIEFVAAVAMFGLPQALFFHLKAGRLRQAAALRWVVASVLVAFVAGLAYALVVHGEPSLVAGFALAIALCVAHGQLRGLLLAHTRTRWFNVATSLPQVLLLLGVIGAIAGGQVGASVWPWLFVLAYALAALFAWYWLRGLASSASATNAMKQAGVTQAGWRALGGYGLAAWLSAMLSTAAIVFVQRWVGTSQGDAALGQFTLALTLIQVPLAPVSYAVPLLFRRWMEQPGRAASRRWALRLWLALVALAVCTWLAAPLWPQLGLGAGYAGTTQVLAVLLASAAAEAGARLLAANANASGLPWIATRAEAARWLVIAAAWLWADPGTLIGLCWIWSAAATASLAVYALHAKRVDRPAGIA